MIKICNRMLEDLHPRDIVLPEDSRIPRVKEVKERFEKQLKERLKEIEEQKELEKN